jgi:hypothetical protein
MITIPPLPERLQTLCDCEYPRFSARGSLLPQPKAVEQDHRANADCAVI